MSADEKRDEMVALPGTLIIPKVPGASITVTYMLDDPAQVLRIYENWILAVRWNTPGVRFTAQSESTSSPTLPPAVSAAQAPAEVTW